MGGAREGTDALQDLGRVLLLVKIDGEEHVVFLQVERGGLACSEEMRDVLHLNEGHGRLLEFDSGRPDGEVNKPIICGVCQQVFQ